MSRALTAGVVSLAVGGINGDGKEKLPDFQVTITLFR